MRPHSIYFSLPSLSVSFTSDQPFAWTSKESLLLQAYVPGAQKINSIPRKVDFKFFHRTGKPKFQSTFHQCTLTEDWGPELPLDFFHLLYSLVRLHWLRQGLFPVHAACIDLGGGILLAGHTGTGKTTALLDLIRQKQGKIFSGNKTLLRFSDSSEMAAIAGTPTMTLPTSDLTRYRGVTVKKFTSGNRSLFLLPQRHYSPVSKLSIRAIVLLRLNDGASIKQKISPLSALHRLYSFFLDSVNADALLFGGSALCNGTVRPSDKSKLARQLAIALQTVPTLEISGSLNFISHQLTTL